MTTTGTTVAWTLARCDLGVLVVAATDRGLCFVGLGDEDADVVGRLRARLPQADLVRDDDTVAPFVDAVRRRAAGDPTSVDPPLDITGTAFQQRVWDALRRIPYGEVRTYGEIAEEIGAPKAVRAVGTACGSNPVGLVIPCHRVVPKHGGIGRYGFGPERKRVLLRREGASVPGATADPDDTAASVDQRRGAG